MLTLANIKASSIKNISSVNVSDPAFVQQVNDAGRILADMGDFWATVRIMRGCVYNGCIYWPKNVTTVLAIHDCMGVVPVKNHWYEFSTDYNRWYRQNYGYTGVGGYTGFGTGNGWMSQFNQYSPGVVEFTGTSPVFRPLPAPNSILRFKVSNPADIGKTVTIYAPDENNLPIVKVLTLADTGVDSPPLRGIEHISKDVTVGEIRSYWFQPGEGLISLAGIYRPNDQNPEFLTSKWIQKPGCGSSYISALVKLGWEDMQVDTDLCLIENLDAIKLAVQSIRLREAEGDELADAKEMTAIRRLNSQLRTKIPDEQIVAVNNTFGDGFSPAPRLF